MNKINSETLIPCFVLNNEDYLGIDWCDYGFYLSESTSARVLFVGVDYVGRETISQFQSLELIVTRTTNSENINVNYPVVYLEKEDVKYILSTAEFTMFLMLCLSRRANEIFYDTSHSNIVGHDLRGKTLGIFGYGRIGKAVDNLATSFGMEVIIYDRHRKNKREILEMSDVVSLHLPARDEFINFISDYELSCMKKTSYLINTARPYMVNKDSMIKYLSNRSIAGVAMDYMIDGLDSISHKYNLILTPHLGGSTRESVTHAAKKVVERAQYYMSNLK